MSAKNRWTMFGVLPALLVLAGAAEVEAARFHILGTRGGSSSSTWVSDVSADGTTAVGFLFYHGGVAISTHPRRWNAEGELLSAGSFEGAARAVSADGSVVIGEMGSVGYILPSYWPGTGEAFRWASGGGVVGLGYLTEEVTRSFAFAVSADGSTVVGGSDSDSGHRAFRWTQSEGMVGLGILLGHHRSSAEGVSPDGSVIVGSSSSDSAAEAFCWTADGGMVGLGALTDHLHSYAQDVSADGSVVVGYSGNRPRWAGNPFGREPAEDYEAFVWTEADGTVGLGYLPGHGWSQAYAVSADGSIVVGASARVVYDGEYHSVSTREAFIWDAEDGMRSLRDVLINEYQLEVPLWPLGSPTGISADGKVIVGNSEYYGRGAAWMVVIPEPSTIVLALTGLLGLLLYAWRRRRRAA